MTLISTAYEVHRGWTPQAIITVAITAPVGIACVTGLFYVFSVRLIILAVICIWGAVLFTLGAISHKLALRVDEQGISFINQGRRAQPATVPWSDVQSVLIVKPRNVSMLGVITKQSAGIPVEPNEPPKLDVSLPLTNWRVDLGQLSAAVREHAPEVVVADKR